MKKIVTSALMLSLCMSLVFVACKKEDEEKPVIKVSSPTTGKHYHHNDEIHFKAVIEDNEELKEYKIDIHYAGDGHSHKSGGDHVKWEFEDIVSISGEKAEIDRMIKVPDNAEEGKYHFIVEATDAAGNEADFIEIDIEIEDH